MGTGGLRRLDEVELSLRRVGAAFSVSEFLRRLTGPSFSPWALSVKTFCWGQLSALFLVGRVRCEVSYPMEHYKHPPPLLRRALHKSSSAGQLPTEPEKRSIDFPLKSHRRCRPSRTSHDVPTSSGWPFWPPELLHRFSRHCYSLTLAELSHERAAPLCPAFPFKRLPPLSDLPFTFPSFLSL